MNYDLKTVPSFDREAKKLYKRYKSPASDLLELKKILQKDPKSGIPLGNSCYKIRLSIASKNKGKSGGA